MLAIATDQDLRFLNYGKLMNQAANVAFELCTKNVDTIINLVNLINQKQTDLLLNLKAAAKFSEVVLSDEDKYKNQIKFAISNLNIRWLKNLAEPFQDKLNEEENENIDKLISYIRSYFN